MNKGTSINRHAWCHAAAAWLLGTCLAAALPTVDFTSGAIQKMSDTLYSLPLNVMNNMDVEPTGGPYNDMVSEFKIEGFYSATAPTFANLPLGWVEESVSLTDPARRLWSMHATTSISLRRLRPGSSDGFAINITLPSGLPGSAIRYGAVSGWGKTFSHFDQPEGGDTFVGPVGVEYPVPVVGLTVAAGQVVLGLKGLVVGREYRVMRSADLGSWEEAARFTVSEDPWPASGRVDREWSEAAVLPGRRYYRLEWDEP